MTRDKYDCIPRLQTAGIRYADARALRRIAMTLHRWHELECGDSNDYASWCITRGYRRATVTKADGTPAKRQTEFTHDENGKPFIERHPHHGDVHYTAIPDRERGALKRLAAIMARYPGFASYVQTDSRGCSLYILRPEDLDGSPTARDSSDFREWLSCNYSRGIGVCK